MVRKDYIKIADAITLDACKESELVVVRQIVKRLADMLEDDNDRFNRNQFYNYINERLSSVKEDFPQN